jgi:adenylate cyclase
VRIPIAELQAAGLYDPAAPNAAERLALITWLVERGATLEHMVRVARAGSLVDVAGHLPRLSQPHMTLAEASARTGVSVERIDAMRFAAGLPRIDPAEGLVTEDDVRTVAAFAMGEALFGADAVRRFMQVIGGSLARMAEAAIAVSFVNLEAPIREAGAGELAQAQVRLRAAESTAPLADAVAQLFKAHVAAAGGRLRGSLPHRSLDSAAMTVGFVDLVGFTTLARRVQPRTLATIVERFEETAHDTAASRDGRIVKFVGDAVMFVTAGAAAACDIALALTEQFARHEEATPRGGVAAGEVVVRGGDYYGPVVNLAARLAEIAIPSEVLVTDVVAGRAAGGGFAFELAGRRLLKGFDEPVRVLSAARAPGTRQP